MISELEAARTRDRLNAFHAWLGKRQSWRTEEAPEGLEVSNEERSALELYEWHTQRPASYFAYWTMREGLERPFDFDCAAAQTRITNWMGETLGIVTHAGKVWTSNFGDKRRAVTVKGTNGVTYHGTAQLSSGTYVRLKAAKVQHG